MKIHKAGATSRKWNATDEITPTELKRDWIPGSILKFDATIEKFGDRHTDVGVELSESDVWALFDVVKRRRAEVIRELKTAETRIAQLEEAFGKVYGILATQNTLSPQEIKALRSISWHFWMS